MVIRTIEGLQDAIKMLNTSLTWTLDFETTGLNVRKDKIIGFGCANPDNLDQVFYVITKEFKDGLLIDVIADEHIKPIMQILKSKRLVTFNGSYDSRICYHYYGVNLISCIYSDVMLLAHAVNENRQNYKLKNIAAEIYGDQVLAEKEDMLASIKANGGTDKEYYKADSSLMANYGIQDNILTAKLFKHFDTIIRKENQYKFFYEQETMPLYRLVTIPLELNGIPVDVPAMKKAQEEITVEMERIEDEIQAEIAPHLEDFNNWYLNKEYPIELSGHFLDVLASLTAPADWPRTKAGGYSFSAAAFKKKQHLLQSELYKYYDGQERLSTDLIKQIRQELLSRSGVKYIFNISSKDHLKRLIFTKLKEIPMSKTDKGNAQIDDKLLDKLADKYEWVKKLRTYNKLTKLKGTYIDRLLEKQEDGIFYPSYFMLTTTGRFSGDVQQLPRIKTLEDENDPIFLRYNNMIRNFFISGEGKKLVDADYSSLEVVVFADDSQDEALLNVIRNGLDLYSQVAINVYGQHEYSADKKSPMFLKKHKPELRQKAKSFALGFRYGLQPFKLSKDLNISESEASGVQRQYFNSFPRLKQRMDEIIQEAKTTGRITSKAGRVRRLPGLVDYVKKYGDILFDGLELWKEYNESVTRYAQMKEIARECRGAINNSLNFPIQSFAASIVSRASIEISKEFNKRNMQSYICLSVHDEICVLAPDSEVEAVSQIMRDKMENTTKLSVPLEAEPIVGTCYGEVK